MATRFVPLWQLLSLALSADTLAASPAAAPDTTAPSPVASPETPTVALRDTAIAARDTAAAARRRVVREFPVV